MQFTCHELIGTSFKCMVWNDSDSEILTRSSAWIWPEGNTWLLFLRNSSVLALCQPLYILYNSNWWTKMCQIVMLLFQSFQTTLYFQKSNV